MSLTKPIVIRITGDSGDGIQLLGEQLTISAAISGKEVRTLPDFPAEIRAPQGSVAGVSAFQLAIAEGFIFTAGEEIDVLVAMNPAALKKSIQYLRPNALLLINSDSFQQSKDLLKVGLNEHYINEIAEYYQVLSVPIIQNTLSALKEAELSHSEAKKAKNFYVLGIILWLFALETQDCLAFIDKKFAAKPLLASANARALKAGYNYALTLELIRRDSYQLGNVQRGSGDYRQITGVEAVGLALATLATQLKKELLVAGYPITPASAILEEAAKLKDFGLKLLQAEDEIAAVCACLGASFAGSLAITCTSGPGLDLKSEAIGLGVVSELPMVILNVSRAGSSTGLPTKTGQSDLHAALYNRHGESPLPVIAANSPGDCFKSVIEAFRIAVKYMTPVIVIMDAYLAISAEPWQIPDLDGIDLPNFADQQNKFSEPYKRDNNLSRSWNIPGTPGYIHQLGGLEKHGEYGQVSYDAANHQNMVNLRYKKIANVAREYSPIMVEGNVNAKNLLISWGSTYGSIKAAMLEDTISGRSWAYLNLRNVNPLPNDLGDILAKYTNIFVAELNAGHLTQEIRAKYLVDAKLITQCNGQPFSGNFLLAAIREQVGDE